VFLVIGLKVKDAKWLGELGLWRAENIFDRGLEFLFLFVARSYWPRRSFVFCWSGYSAGYGNAGGEGERSEVLREPELSKG
jgi:hypothetical protein